MNKFKFYFIVLIATITLFSCEKDENTIPIVPLKDYKEQFKADSTQIYNYLDSHHITVVNNRGKQDDQDVTISKITDRATQTSILSYKNNTGDTYPQLRSRPVDFHGFEYKVYYLILRQGSENPDPNPNIINRGGESPCNTDSVLTSYSGSYLKETTTTEDSTVSATFFEESKFPSQFFSLLGVIRGWSEIFPQFKTGWYKRNETNGTISFYDFGAGVMFIPSGLAYYNSGSFSIPSYSPLVFSFKLYEIDRIDTDGDGIYNYQEDISDGGEGVGYMYSYANKTNYPNYPVDAIRYSDDTDRDGIPNFLDIDDDGDNYSTKVELKKPDGTYHTFETVPSCSGQTVKRHLTASCKPPYTD
jgi:hypothetical protein